MAEFAYNNTKNAAPVIFHSNSIAATILESLSKRILTSAEDLALLIN